MEFDFHEIDFQHSKIYLLEFLDSFNPENYLEHLSEIEKKRFFAFSNDKRKKEFVATRILKHHVFPEQKIEYHLHGAPFILDSDHISISHAQNLVGIATNSDFQVGFDIEEIHPKVLKIYSKFLNEKEQKIFDLNDVEELISCWSYKETLYKLAGRKEIDFKKDLLLLSKENDFVEAKICNPSEQIFVNLHKINFRNYVITINSKALTHVQK